MIPENISRTDIIRAVELIQNEDIPRERHSTKWSVLYDGNKYPPKYFYLYGRQYFLNVNFRF